MEEEEPEFAAISVAESVSSAGLPPFPLRPGTRELLRFAVAIMMMRGAKAITDLDVVLASLARFYLTDLDRADLREAATTALIEVLAEPKEKRVWDALSACGVDRAALKSYASGVSDGDQLMASVHADASALASRLGQHDVFSHHVVAPAVAHGPLPDEALRVLGVSQSQLRATLRTAIAGRWPEELPAVWDSVLGQPAAGKQEDTAVAWAHDAPAVKDQLRREALAEVLKRRFKHLVDTGSELSFLVHIDGSWGAGKSSLLNFLEERIKTDFLVVRFNAWQQSRIGPPWWSLLTAARQAIAGERGWLGRRRLRISETWARVRRTGALYSLALLILLAAIAVVAYALWPHKSTLASLSTDAKAISTIVAAVAVFWAGSRVAAQFLLWDSAGGARLFEKSSISPMREISSQFGWLMDQSPLPVVFFIDDLDRCDSTYVVNFLDSVQTIVRDANGPAGKKKKRSAATFVVAADGAWLRTSYEGAYTSFADAIGQPGRPLGYLFLDKIFQLSMPLPVPPKTAQQSLLDTLLHLTPSDNAEITEQITAAKGALGEARGDGDQVRAILHDLPGPVAEAVSGDAALVLMDPQTVRRTEHKLQKFAELLDGNPRTTKRFVNTFTMIEAIRTMENTEIDTDALALWSIIRVRWPEVADFLQREPAAVSRLTAPNPDGFPEPLKAAVNLPDLRRVVQHPQGGPLTAESVRRCSGGGDGDANLASP